MIRTEEGPSVTRVLNYNVVEGLCFAQIVPLDGITEFRGFIIGFASMDSMPGSASSGLYSILSTDTVGWGKLKHPTLQHQLVKGTDHV